MAARSRKATVKSPEVRRPGLIRKLLAAGVLLGLLAWLVPMISQQALVIWDRPVKEVAIEGPFRLVSREQVAALLSAHINTGFWSLDIAALQRAVEADPWVDRVSIRRKWPDRLNVEVVEQEPIARWADTGFVNVRAELIEAADAPEKLAALPRLVAESGALEKMLQYYQTMAALMYARDLRLSSIEVDARGSWTVSLADGVAIRFGRHGLQARMQRFARVFDAQLKTQWSRVAGVDVRYNNGVAVSWRAG